MNRDEIIEGLSCVVGEELLTRLIVDDAFDPFVAEIVNSGIYLPPTGLAPAWSWFAKGWHAGAAFRKHAS